MKITKYGHACLVVEQGENRLIVDPGFYTEDLPEVSNVAAIVITHQHDDHCYEPQLDRILANNPDAKIFGPDEVVKRLGGYPYDQDPGRPGWTPILPNDRWADRHDSRPVQVPF